MHKTIIDALKVHAERNPDKMCVGSMDGSLSYGECKKIVQKGQLYLSSLGVKKGDRVCLVGEQNYRFLMVLLSVHALGGTVVPLEKGIAEERISFLLKELDTEWLGCEEKDELADCKIIRYQDFENTCINCDKEDDCANSWTGLQEDDIQDILFTTGSTGTPKGIMLLAKTVRAVAENVIDSVEMTDDECEIITCPLFHSMGLRRFYSGVLNGSSLVISRGSAFLDDVVALIDRFNVTAMTIVPGQLAVLMRFYKNELIKRAERLRYIQTGTTYINDGLVRDVLTTFPKTKFFVVYGCTEGGCISSCNYQYVDLPSECVGRLTVNSKIAFDVDGKIVNSTTKDKAGYILIGGSVLMHGYWKDKEKTEAVLCDGYLHTEDIGYSDRDGNLYLIGRKSDVINCGGNKVSPIEIESTAMCIEAIEECACIPMPDKMAGQVPKLIVVLRKGANITGEEIKKILRNKLEAFKVPREISYIESLPKAANGKILRKNLIG